LIISNIVKDSPQLEDIYGEEKILEWRRSYDTAPPSLYDKQFAENMGSQQHSRRATTLMNPRYLDTRMMNRSVRSSISDPSYGNNGFTEYNDFPYPSAESLKQCEERAFGFWRDVIAPRVLAGDRVLIVSHANTIRALVKAVDQIDDSMIAHLKIPNGIPLVYTMDSNLQPILDLTDDLGFQGEYLVSARNHGKMMEYERCVRKKLRSLFEYLDTDKDGRITPSCLQSGMIRLQAYDKTKKDGLSVNGNAPPQICEYEIEELLRAVPSADEHGGVTLKSFLKAQATLLPMLSKLRLLQ
jgi:bisphosphoglycerate-dependent phosphoglycerate mutase